MGGAFPRRAEDLATLPGIGRSTAGAIASFCFSERVPILDANVRRVLTRVLAFDADLAVARNERELWDLAQQLCPTEDLQQAMPRYTQGLMDLGATICTPRKPSCLVCPLQQQCRAARFGNPENYPVRTRKLKRSSEAWWLLIAVDGQGRVWLERRPQQGIWRAFMRLPCSMNARRWSRPPHGTGPPHDPPTGPSCRLSCMCSPTVICICIRCACLSMAAARMLPWQTARAAGPMPGPADMGLPAPVRKLLDAQFAG